MRQTFSLTFFSAVILSAGLCAALAVQEAEQGETLQRIAHIQADPTALQVAIEAGEERTLLCRYCHGAEGYSLKSEVPNLAGQNVRYLLEQIDQFSSGARTNYVMNQLAKNFTAEDKINIALFYNSQPGRSMSVDKTLAAQGQPLYQRLCSGCHGADAHGNETLARLAGQRPDYVEYSLRQFRAGAAGKSGVRRRNLLMAEVAKPLTDKQIKGLAAFVAQMP